MKWLVTYLLMFVATLLMAQTGKDTLLLNDVVKVERISADNTMLSPFTDIKNQSGKRLSSALSEFSSVYIKNYGNGQLASIAVRGTSATQTNIEWNGVKLNSPSLGQVDLSLFTLGTHDDLQLIRTGYGGTIGGTLRMNNNVEFDSSIAFNAAIRAGSFKTVETFGELKYNGSHVSGGTKLSYLTSANNFKFRNLFKQGHPYQTQQNARVKLLSFMQQFNVRINQRNIVGLYLWLTDADRQIPPIMSKADGKESQLDQSIRAMANWKGRFKQLQLGFTTGYIRDYLRYKNPEASLDEVSVMQAIRNTFTATFQFPFSLVLNAAVNYDYEQADIRSYGTTKRRNVGGIKVYADYYTKGLKLHLGFRQDLVDKQLSAFSPEAGVNYSRTIKGNHNISAGLLASRNFRFPTLNDLYWVPGGNPDLKQEKSWNGELSFKYSYKQLLQLSVNGFAIYVENWIQWVPQGSDWGAVNFKRVLSRGFEAALQVTNTADNSPKKFRLYFNASYSFTRTTNLDAFSQFDQSKGKQLIYVPLHSVVGGLQLQYRRFYIRSVTNYVSTLFISTDNSQSLNGFFIANVEVGKDFVFGTNEIGLAFRINNVGDAQYQSVAQRPMPGRGFEGILRLNLKK